jgi:type IV pilus assembly protein PilC
MPEFTCICLNTGGRKVKININAVSETEAASNLKSRGFTVIEVEINSALNPFIFLSRVKRKEVILFFTMFATLLKSDVSISEAVGILEDQAESLALKKILGNLRERIEAGGSLSEAMEENEKVFTKMGVNMVRAGELGGILDVSLERVAKHLEESAALRLKMILSLMYPSIILVVALVVVIFLVVFVIPKFATILGSGKLPPNTRFLLDSSDYLQNNWKKILIGISGFLCFVIFLFKNEQTKPYIDKYVLKVPVIGQILRFGAIVRFTKTMAALLGSSINLVDALKASGETIENRAVNSVIENMTTKVLSGESLSSALENNKIFTPMTKALIKIGEHSGLMDQSMNTAGELHEKMLEDKIAKMSAMIEPMLIIVLGVIVGYVAWGLISGMLAMYTGAV